MTTMITTARIPLDELASTTHGIVTTPELHAAGYDNHAIRWLVRRRALIRLRRGAFAVGHLAFGEDGRRMAAVRCAGDGAALTSISAGRCWMLTNRREPLVDVVVPAPRRPVPGARLTIERTLPATAYTTYRNVPILTPSWSILAMATWMEAAELTRVLREASYRQHLDLPGLLGIADRGERPGVVTLRRALDLRCAGSDGYASRLEAAVDRYLTSIGIPARISNAYIDVAGDRLQVDLVLRALGICVEIDGPIHDDPDVQREDRRRQALLEAAGWIVIRIHWRAWEDDRASAVEPLVEAVRRATIGH